MAETIGTVAEKLVFSATDLDGFGRYHDLYSSGTDVYRTDESFRASINAHKFHRMLLFNRKVAGAAHYRSVHRVRRDGFDHVNLQVLKSGTMVAGLPGDERQMRPGDVVIFDTTRPQRTIVAEADYVSVAINRDAITTALPDIERWHGTILSGEVSGLLSDFLLSLGRNVGSISPAIGNEGASMAGRLLSCTVGSLPSSAASNNEPIPSLNMLRWRAESFIEAHLGERSLDADMVAAGIGTTRSTLYAAFAPVRGVARDILRRRVMRLSEALLQPFETRSITALAYDLGFADENHCSRAFKSRFGCPPRQFRAEARRSHAVIKPSCKAEGWATWWGDIS